MSGHLIALENQLGVLPVGVRETLRRLFAKCVLKVTGTKATTAYYDEQIFFELKVGIDGTIHRVQAIWGATFPMDD